MRGLIHEIPLRKNSKVALAISSQYRSENVVNNVELITINSKAIKNTQLNFDIIRALYFKRISCIRHALLIKSLNVDTRYESFEE